MHFSDTRKFCKISSKMLKFQNQILQKLQKLGKKCHSGKLLRYKTILLILFTNKIITWKLEIATLRHLEIMH